MADLDAAADRSDLVARLTIAADNIEATATERRSLRRGFAELIREAIAALRSPPPDKDRIAASSERERVLEEALRTVRLLEVSPTQHFMFFDLGEHGAWSLPVDPETLSFFEAWEDRRALALAAALSARPQPPQQPVAWAIVNFSGKIVGMELGTDRESVESAWRDERSIEQGYRCVPLTFAAPLAQPVATAGGERADLFPITGAILDAGRMAFEQIEYLDGMPSEEVVLTILKAISAAAYRPPVTQPNAGE